MSNFQRIVVIGAGAWGTALATTVARAGRAVSLIERDLAVAAAVATKRESPRLPGVRIEDSVQIATGGAAAESADAILLAVPAQAMRSALKALPPLKPGTPLVVCAKGIEQGTRRFMSEIVAEIIPAARVAILSGPSFASDVGKGLPAAVTLAAHDENLAKDLAFALGTPTFRLYHSTDVRGAELGGAAKNVLAIAAGIVAGKALGASAAAAITTRGFAELVRFGRAMGARPETLMGLSGLGDLILTCGSAQSRNFSLGYALGQGSSPKDGALAEGAFTAEALIALAREHKVEMPIAEAVEAVLDRKLTVNEAIETLLMRPFRSE
jgi:glycerol-3-phosphate dehydrogenase (NAD(P)+)